MESGPLLKEDTRLRVLIADDVQETRRTTRLMLATNPEVEVVAIAQNGRQAIDMAREYMPDIAIMDVNMPEIDGISAIRAMLQRTPEMVCIVISAEKNSQTLRAAMVAGAREYLIKPFTVDELNLAVKQAGRLALAKRKSIEEEQNLRQQRNRYLKRLADEYAKARRTDDQALDVFEELVSDSNCEPRWLMTLAMIYVIRQKWGKLKDLAERLEQRVAVKSPSGS